MRNRDRDGELHGRSWVPLALAALALVAASDVAAFDVETFYPLGPNDFATFILDGVAYETSVVLPATTRVNGAVAHVIEATTDESGVYRQYATSDQSGLRLHGEFMTSVWIDGVGFLDLTATYSPPAPVLDATFSIGSETNGQGSVSFGWSNGVRFSQSYEIASRVVGLERIRVPFGAVEAVRVDQSMHVFGSVFGEWYSDTLTRRTWLAAGLGMVRQETSWPDGSSTAGELVMTNRQYVPEPSSLASSAAACLATFAVSRHRRASGRSRDLDTAVRPVRVVFSGAVEQA